MQKQKLTLAVTYISTNVVDPGSCAFLTPGSGMGKNQYPGSRMNNPDHISEILKKQFLLGYNT